LGIEKYHEKLLHGKVGYQEVEVNNQGRILRTLTFQEPVPGKDIVLSIDLGLQRAAQQALGNNKGAIVAIDPRDGGVLALYSNPSYDPNLFVDGISRINYRKLLLSPDRPLINRATQGQYPPASTIKPHIGLLGLESNVINMQSRFFDTGEYSLKGSDHVWRDWWRRGHGWVDLTAAVAVSCDTFFYDLAYKLGIDRISQYMAHFGFGKYTGVDLHEEANGNMPSRGWKRATYDEAWYPGDTVIVGIGQGAWTATPLQIAQSISILINGGKVISPQLLRGFNSPEGYQPSPSTLTKRFSVNKHNLDNVLSSMYQVIYSAKGTARNAFKNAPYVSAGKTGTAQLISIAQDEEYDEDKIDERHRDNAMYVGYAPYYKPEIVVAVVMENAGGGGKKAAPVARIIMDHYFSSTLPTKPNSVIDVSEEYADSRL
jgi:penicillin-binding protein 2